MPSTTLTFAAASFVLLIIPGPAVLYILNRSIADGRRAGLSAAAGLSVGNLVHALAAAAGLSALLAASATAFEIVKWAGAAYLIGTGLRGMLTPVDPIDATTRTMSPRRSFSQGVVVNTLNPKVALFFVSYLPGFLRPEEGAAWGQALVLGLVFVVIGLIIFYTNHVIELF